MKSNTFPHKSLNILEKEARCWWLIPVIRWQRSEGSRFEASLGK
jgi:hypothetical protein